MTLTDELSDIAVLDITLIDELLVHCFALFSSLSGGVL